MLRSASLFSLGAIFVAAVASSACTELKHNEDHHKRPPNQVRVPNEYLITLQPETDVKAIRDVYGQFGIKEINDLGGEVYLVVLVTDPGEEQIEELVEEDERFRLTQPNLIYWANRTPSKFR